MEKRIKANSMRIILLGIVMICLLLFGCQPPAAEEKDKTEREVPVEIMEIKSKKVEQNLPLTGILHPINSVDLIAEVSGEIEKIKKELGESVSTTDTLAYIDDIIPLSQYKQAQSQYMSAINNLEIARKNLASDKTLFQNKDISQIALDNSVLAVKSAEAQKLSAAAALEIAKKSYYDTRITSPIKGIIARKHFDIGAMINIGSPLYRVVDISKLKLEVFVPQAYVNRVHKGSAATIKVAALSNMVFNGKVVRISPQADEISGGYLVEIEVTNTPSSLLKGGMTADISLLMESLEDQIVVPDYSLVSRNGERFVYVVNKDRAKLTRVIVKEILGTNAVLMSGIKAGDKIVTVGMKNLGINTKIKVETAKKK